MPVTARQGKALAILGGAGPGKDEQPLRDRVTQANVFDGIDRQVADLLVALGDDPMSHLGELTRRAEPGCDTPVSIARRPIPQSASFRAAWAVRLELFAAGHSGLS